MPACSTPFGGPILANRAADFLLNAAMQLQMGLSMPPTVQKALDAAPSWFQRWQVAWASVIVCAAAGFAVNEGLDVLKGMASDIGSLKSQTIDIPKIRNEVSRLTLRMAELEAKGIMPGAEAQIREIRTEVREMRDVVNTKLSTAPADVKAELKAELAAFEARLNAKLRDRTNKDGDP